MSTILADYEQRKGQALFIHSILRVGYALWRPARTYKPRSCLHGTLRVGCALS